MFEIDEEIVVALRGRAWIEIAFVQPSGLVHEVALRGRAWIEIRDCTARPQAILSRPPREGVD